MKDGELQDKYNNFWNNVSHNIKKGFDSEPVYNKKHLKTKTNLWQEK